MAKGTTCPTCGAFESCPACAGFMCPNCGGDLPKDKGMVAMCYLPGESEDDGYCD